MNWEKGMRSAHNSHLDNNQGIRLFLPGLCLVFPRDPEKKTPNAVLQDKGSAYSVSSYLGLYLYSSELWVEQSLSLWWVLCLLYISWIYASRFKFVKTKYSNEGFSLLSEDVLSIYFCVDLSLDHSCAEKRPTALVAAGQRQLWRALLHPRKEIKWQALGWLF